MLPRNVLGICLVTVLLFHAGAGQSGLACPAVRTTSGWLDLFPLPCLKHSECSVMGANHLCCKGYCTKAIRSNDALVQKNSQSQANKAIVIASSTATTVAPNTTVPPTTTVATTTTTRMPVPTTSTTTTTTTSRPPTASPTAAAVVVATTTESPLEPFFKVLPIKTSKPKTTAKATAAGTAKTPKLVCPKAKNIPVVLFPIPCENSLQCQRTTGPDQVCCGGRCVQGTKPPKVVKPLATHQPLLGVIPRECPAEPLGEFLFEVQACKSDADCWPRVCCPDGKRSYCRTAKARLDLVPVASQINEPVRAVEKYLQCTAPPAYDLFPRQCNSAIDCFPNLCCAEGGKKHCRPPQRSLLALLAGVGQRFGSTIVNFRQAAQANRINEINT